jgi:hypothetical protein
MNNSSKPLTVADFELAQRFAQIVAAAQLPLPDQVDLEPHEIVLRWSETGFEVHMDRDRDDIGPIDELAAAMIQGLPPDEWPYPSADGYADYVPPT